MDVCVGTRGHFWRAPLNDIKSWENKKPCGGNGCLRWCIRETDINRLARTAIGAAARQGRNRPLAKAEMQGSRCIKIKGNNSYESKIRPHYATEKKRQLSNGGLRFWLG